jgi:flagellar biosynthesis/type III secretory pathway chaperone
MADLLGDSVYQALGLKETLDDERRALEAQDVGALLTILEQKEKCVSALRKLDEQRSRLCAAAGFPAGPDQMEEMVGWCDENGVVANTWQHLMEIAIDCNSRNLTNGSIIRGRKQQIEAGLAVVRGGAPNPDTYNRSGMEPSGASLRPIAEA